MLRSLGATPAGSVDGADLSPALLDPVPAGEFGAGLPPGTLAYCTGVALVVGALAGAAVSGTGVAMQLRLPEVMAAAYGSSFEMRPGPPRAAGGGFVHADLGSPGDRDAFGRVRSLLMTEPPAPALAAAAQEWRLPVCDYRPRVPAPPVLPITFTSGPAAAAGDRLRVLDLTNMWAGPLTTWLLQTLGAEVTKVEPGFRPDGFRALDGGGIHPSGRQCDPGRDSGMWNALNEGKEVVDLDLRVDADRDRFLEMAAASDVVIDSFSPRVMPNFGLELPGGPLYVSMPAFPPGPEREWVAYGSGVHAVSGLGDLGGGRFAAPAVSYPDPVGGFTAAVGILAAVAARRRGIAVARVECPLAASVQPLLHFRGDGGGDLEADAAGVGARLLAAGESRGLLERRPVCNRELLHPGPIFQPKQNVF